MATGFYIGVDGKARKVKGGYIGVDGKARKIKKGYIGDENGIARLCWSGIDPVFANNSWEEIAVACQNGNIPDSWRVGDQKTMAIGGTNYVIDIIGKNHDDYADGSGKAPLTFQLHECYSNPQPMHISANNSGGWSSSYFRINIIQSYLNSLPLEVKSNIKEVNKLTSSGYGSSDIVTTVDKLFLLSEIEVLGAVTYSKPGEGNQYEYYEAENTLKKKIATNYAAWWLRSPSGNRTDSFCHITSAGGLNYTVANESLGVSFAFCF